MRVAKNDIIETALKFNDHRDSDKPRSISTTTLIGPSFKAWKSYVKTPKNFYLRPMKSRSAFIGSGVHQRFETVYKDYNNVMQELYRERYVEEYDSWISGTFDLLIEEDGLNYLGDIKTGYGKKHSNVEKTTLQLSVYRWLNHELDIEDEAYIYFISQSNNVYETIEIQLMSVDDTENMILRALEAIQQEPGYVDCNDGIRFNMCSFCEFECNYRKEEK
jgi:hypothetical protein